VHGGPIHIGNPGAIGIRDLGKPDFGDAVSIRDGEVPVFWACGVTQQAVAMNVKPEMVITHAPGHMLITDIRDESLAVL
ncbi:D-glutamate cyclase family protein, partial [Bacillus sp. LR--39]